MIELFRHIQYLIRRSDCVAIPQTGEIKAVTLPAFYSADGEMLLPPARTIYFEEYPSADVEKSSSFIPLVDSYARKNGVDSSKARELLMKDIAGFKHSIDSTGMIMAGRLGTFFYKKNHLEFKPNINTTAFNPFAFLPKAESNREVASDKLPESDKYWSLKRKVMSVISIIAASAAAVCG